MFVVHTNYVCFQTKVPFLAAMQKCGNKDLGQSCVQNEMPLKCIGNANSVWYAHARVTFNTFTNHLFAFRYLEQDG